MRMVEMISNIPGNYDILLFGAAPAILPEYDIVNRARELLA
jgi:hypothetical protein